MESAILAMLVGVVGVGLMLYEGHYKRTHGLHNAADGTTSEPRTAFAPDRRRSFQDLGVTMKFDAPCPQCDQTPVEILEMVDGKAWICPHCGHQETEGAADIDAFVDKLGCHDPERVNSWREAPGLGPK